ncbi:hypothetical protein AN618_17580 [Fervidicola ferrireducens]|uniref:HD Cas3-type domain-containing protein n=1 Tax=Fervidicola ferrireducens TaxID=520764 RepID=A0A140L5M3_9FIRM|nr:CRISPR-associated helicase/endonuclease Cas3 [Fervidicola ferrireducens]KXG75848.1 hypothetical protein AN618_17580 [Fervidicola ferrireducens]
MNRHYYSHIGKFLKEHLKEVGEEAKKCLDHPALPARDLLSKAAFFIGLTHDLGKFTTYFQKHLNEEKIESNLSNHAFISAVLGAYIVRKRLCEFPDMPERKFIPLLCYLVIHRHHGNLKDPRDLLPRTRKCLQKWPEDIKKLDNEFYRPFSAMKIQLQDLCSNWDKIRPDLEELGIADEVKEFLENQPVVELFTDLESIYFEIEETQRNDEVRAARLCLWGQLLFSALIDTDKFSAASVEKPGRAFIPKDIVEKYIAFKYPKPRHEMDRLRNEFHSEVRKRIEEVLQESENFRVLSITAPTGMGKTFAAMDAALRIRGALEEKWKEKNIAPRIIYALPFINIIEQNYEAYHNVLDSQLGDEYRASPEKYLLRHHYLAEISYAVDNEKKPVEEALLLTESWESEIVITTFVQVFQTIMGYRNRFLKKLHNLVGSILILDEVQSLPVEYWRLTDKVFQNLCRELGLTVLQITATQPMIFQQESSVQLYPDYRKLFECQNRTVLQVDLKEKSEDEWVEWILELYEGHGSLMVVLNTIRASISLYDKVKKRLENCGVKSFGLQPPETEQWIVYLSTNIVPAQRRQRLAELKKHLERGGRAILISTQVVEAGVNIDFPAVLREIGPFDSIVQVAGRCNREGLKGTGFVYIGCLENGRAGHVYGSVHITAARNILKEITNEFSSRLNEKEYIKFVEEYFKLINENSSKERSEKLWNAYKLLIYDSLEQDALSEFELLEHVEQIPVCVPLLPEDEEWLQDVYAKEVLDEKIPFLERRLAAIKHKKRFHDLTIRPLLQRAKENLPIPLNKSGTIRWVPLRDRDAFYDLEFGFKWRPEDHSAWCL